jgi:hypothetical protein
MPVSHTPYDPEALLVLPPTLREWLAKAWQQWVAIDAYGTTAMTLAIWRLDRQMR